MGHEGLHEDPAAVDAEVPAEHARLPHLDPSRRPGAEQHHHRQRRGRPAGPRRGLPHHPPRRGRLLPRRRRDSKINPLSLVRHSLFQPLSQRNDDPAKAVRPFDADRDGTVIGEGGGVWPSKSWTMPSGATRRILRRGRRLRRRRSTAAGRGPALARAIRAALPRRASGRRTSITSTPTV